jgi:hypothetical protein
VATMARAASACACALATAADSSSGTAVTTPGRRENQWGEWTVGTQRGGHLHSAPATRAAPRGPTPAPLPRRPRSTPSHLCLRLDSLGLRAEGRNADAVTRGERYRPSLRSRTGFLVRSSRLMAMRSGSVAILFNFAPVREIAPGAAQRVCSHAAAVVVVVVGACGRGGGFGSVVGHVDAQAETVKPHPWDELRHPHAPRPPRPSLPTAAAYITPPWRAA